MFRTVISPKRAFACYLEKSNLFKAIAILYLFRDHKDKDRCNVAALPNVPEGCVLDED